MEFRWLISFSDANKILTLHSLAIIVCGVFSTVAKQEIYDLTENVLTFEIIKI